jgi:hypothetical protein
MTAVLKPPVPVTVEAQEEDWLIKIEVGAQLTVTPVIVDAVNPVTVTVAVPLMEGSATEVAVMEALPLAPPVKTPALVIAPALAGLTDQVTALL